jgi:hypothetical protein
MEDYPKTFSELEKRFASSEDCRAYLFKQGWQDGFSCPKCGGERMSRLGSGLFCVFLVKKRSL